MRKKIACAGEAFKKSGFEYQQRNRHTSMGMGNQQKLLKQTLCGPGIGKIRGFQVEAVRFSFGKYSLSIQ